MIERKQIFFHRPEEGSFGDCYRTCIGCLLEIEPVEIPNFGIHYDDTEKFFAAADEYLASQCLVRVNHALMCELEDLLRSQAMMNPDVYYVLTGQSKNGTNHCVICLNDKIVWDPAMDDSGIVGPCVSEGQRFFWVEYYVSRMFTKKGFA